MAEKIGYSTNHISKLESARTNPSFELILKIASALELDLKDFFDFESEQVSEKDIILDINNLLKELNQKEQLFVFNVVKYLRDNSFYILSDICFFT